MDEPAESNVQAQPKCHFLIAVVSHGGHLHLDRGVAARIVQRCSSQGPCGARVHLGVGQLHRLFPDVIVIARLEGCRLEGHLRRDSGAAAQYSGLLLRGAEGSGHKELLVRRNILRRCGRANEIVFAARWRRCVCTCSRKELGVTPFLPHVRDEAVQHLPGLIKKRRGFLSAAPLAAPTSPWAVPPAESSAAARHAVDVCATSPTLAGREEAPG